MQRFFAVKEMLRNNLINNFSKHALLHVLRHVTKFYDIEITSNLNTYYIYDVRLQELKNGL